MTAAALRSLDDKALAENKPTLETIKHCLEESVTLVLHDPKLAETQAWRHHLWTVAQTVIPAWGFALKQQHADLLDATCLGTEAMNAATRVSLAQASLNVMIDSLALCQDAPLDGLQLYERILHKLCQEPVFSLYVHTNTLQDPRFFCGQLCAIPGKMANCFGVHQNQKEWYYDGYFYGHLARQLGHAMASVEFPGSMTFCKELFSKMARQGYLKPAVVALYPMALAQIRENPSRRAAWLALWSAVPSDKLNETLLDYVSRAIHAPPSNSAAAAATAATTTATAEILKVASDLAVAIVLNGGEEGHGASNSSKARIEAMLDQVFIKTARKQRQGTRVLLRIALAAAILALPSEQEWTLSSEATLVIEGLVRKIIEVWADPVFIAHGGYNEQAYVTSGLLLSLGYLDENRIKDIIYSTGFMSYIHAWFDSKDMMTARLGVLVAESISRRVDQEGSQFKSGIIDDENDEYKELQGLVYIRDALTPVPLCDDAGVAYIVETPQSDVSDQEEEEEELDPDALVIVDEEAVGNGSLDTVSEDSDLEPYPMGDESSDDEESYGQQKKSKLKKPAYVLDLINYLKDHDDPLKIEMGLKSAAELIRQKTNYGHELEESSCTLAARLLHLPDVYELPQFQEQQQSALTALIVAVPRRVTEYLVDELYGRNTSINAKQIVLASIILGVRELAGWTENEHKEATETARLEFEKLALALPSSSSSLQQRQQKTVGRSRVFSRRMEVEKNKQINTNHLSGLAGSCFFFPLLVGWWEGSQGRTRTWLGQNAMLAERFVMTLNVIMHCATNTPDKRRIVSEYFEFALSLRYANVTKGVTSALLTGLEIILNVSYQGQEKLLLHDYTVQLAEMKNWMEEILELVNEDQLKEKSIRLLARLMQISTM